MLRRKKSPDPQIAPPEDAANAFLAAYGYRIVSDPGAERRMFEVRRGVAPGDDEIARARRHLTRRLDWEELQDGYGSAFRYPAQENPVVRVKRALAHPDTPRKNPPLSVIPIGISIGRRPWPVSQTILLDRMDVERVEGALATGLGWCVLMIGLQGYRLITIGETAPNESPVQPVSSV